MTLNFQPNELERKTENFFNKEYDFKLEDNLMLYKLEQKDFFEQNREFFNIDVKFFSQKQRNVIYRLYAKACEDRLMQKCKKEVVDVLKKYQCYLDINEDAEIFIGNDCIDRYILF